MMLRNIQVMSYGYFLRVVSDFVGLLQDIEMNDTSSPNSSVARVSALGAVGHRFAPRPRLGSTIPKAIKMVQASSSLLMLTTQVSARILQEGRYVSLKDNCYVAIKAPQGLYCLFQNAKLNKALTLSLSIQHRPSKQVRLIYTGTVQHNHISWAG